MEISDVIKNIRNMNDYEIEQKLDYLVRINPGYSNLSDENKNLVLDLIKSYKQEVLRGVPITDFKVRHDIYNLYENRFKLNLKQKDLDDIKKLLDAFKS